MRDEHDQPTDQAPYPFRWPLPRWVLPRVADVSGERRIWQVDHPPGRWLAALEDGNEFIFLNSQLQADHRMRLPALIKEYLRPKVHLDSSGAIVAVSHSEGVSVFDVSSRDGRPRLLWDVPHEPWESWEGADCAIDRGSRLWWVPVDFAPYRPKFLHCYRNARKRERILQRFKSAEHAQQFLVPFSAVSNHFRPRRHRLTASAYRQIRSYAHIAWQHVTQAGVRH